MALAGLQSSGCRNQFSQLLHKDKAGATSMSVTSSCDTEGCKKQFSLQCHKRILQVVWGTQIGLEVSNLTQPHREEQNLASPLTHKSNGSYCALGCCWGLSRDEATVPHLVP